MLSFSTSFLHPSTFREEPIFLFAAGKSPGVIKRYNLYISNTSYTRRRLSAERMREPAYCTDWHPLRKLSGLGLCPNPAAARSRRLAKQPAYKTQKFPAADCKRYAARAVYMPSV